MRCDRCGGESPEGARFCMHCAAPLARACEACGDRLPDAARFCPSCAHPVEPRPDEPPASPTEPSHRDDWTDPRAYTPQHLADRILTTRGALEGERKHVTVLFLDVASYSSLAERADPEQMHALMDRCFQVVLAAVHATEGTVNQFTGDGVMALFGAPLALEDAPRRAVSAAVAIQRDLEPVRREVRERFDRDFQVRIGIHSGPVVVGRIGDDLRMDYTAVGDTTNLAARLQQAAEPGAIWISGGVRQLVAGYFELEEVGELTVKGRQEPVRTFAVRAERAGRGRIEAAAAAGLTPLVGRKRELDALVSAFELASAGQGQVAFLAGEAGIGKSRLLYELRGRLERDGVPHGWFEGRCASFGQSTAFGPIIDGLRRSLGIEDRDDEAMALAKIEQSEARQGGDLAWTLPFVRQLLSLPAGDPALAELDPGVRRSETLRALQARFMRAAQHEPLVFVIEDLHWVDAASEEMLGFFTDSIAATRALLIFTHRPGYRHPFGDRSYHHRIALQALSAADMATMAGSIFESERVPEALQSLIATKAEGNPFFVEEVTASLLEEGVLRRIDGRVELARDISEVTVPDRIQDVLMARIDRLDEAPKRAIQVASVIGREFAVRLLDRIAEVGQRLDAVVDELRALELIYQKATHPELAYMFKHALTHDVAYESVLVRRRQALHRLVGSAIEELYRDRLAEHYEALAHHFELAEEWPKALAYREHAAEKALDAYANQAAAEHAERALAIADRLGERVDDARRLQLAEWLARARWLLSEFEPAGLAWLRAADLAEEAAARATLLGRASWSLHWAHDYERSRRVRREARELARECRDDAALARALLAGSFAHMTNEGTETWDEADAERILRLAQIDPETLAWTQHTVGVAYEWQGRYAEACHLQETALAASQRLKQPDLTIVTTWVLAKASCCLGAYGRALELAGHAADICERVGDRAWRTRLLNTLGWCHSEFGDHAGASELNERSAEYAGEMVALELVPGAPELYGNAAVNWAGNQIALGDLDAAADRLAPVHEDVDRADDPWMLWRYSLHLWDAQARLDLARGDADVALGWVERELEHARRHQAPKPEARALELRGRILLAQDRRDDAARALDDALELARRLGHPPVQWRALALQAELARREGRSRLASERMGQAHRLIETVSASLPSASGRGSLRALRDALSSDAMAALR